MVVHLTIPPVALAFVELIRRCPHLEAVQVPQCQFRRVSKPSRCLLDVQWVRIFEGRFCGYRTDTTEYSTVDDGWIIRRTEELGAAGLDSEKIVAEVARESEVSPGLVGYISASSGARRGSISQCRVILLLPLSDPAT